jgi:hypothetical protein
MKSGMYPNDKEKIMYQHFTNKEINEMLTARIKGKRHAEIAASLGRTPKSVRAKAYAMNKIAPLPTTLEELAENFDVWTQKKPTGRPKKVRRSLDEILDGWDEADEPTKEVTVQAFKDPNITDEEVVQVFNSSKIIYLDCPFIEKDRAKALGAKWDFSKKMWFIYDNMDPTPFAEWLPNSTTKPVQATKTKAKTKPVKEKAGTQKPRTNPNITTAVNTHNYFVIRIPKVYVWVVITASLMAAAWYVGKTY